MAYFRGLQIATNQLKAMAKSIEDSIRVNPCRKNNCIMLAFNANGPGIKPVDTQCCGKKRNSDALASGGEYKEEIVNGLVETGVSDYYVEFVLFSKWGTTQGSKEGWETRCEKLLVLELQPKKVGGLELPMGSTVACMKQHSLSVSVYNETFH